MKLLQLGYFHINLNMATCDFMMIKNLHLFLTMKAWKASNYDSKNL